MGEGGRESPRGEAEESVDNPEDNEDVNDEDAEEDIGGHAKMVAFQAAIRAVLGRQVEKMEQEVRSTNRLVAIGNQEVEESARELHDHQKKLVLEEDGVRVINNKLAKQLKKRTNREEENGRFRVEVEQPEEEMEARNGSAGELRDELNKLSGEQIHLQAVRLGFENQVTLPIRQWCPVQVGVDQACTDKGEEDFKGAQEAKAVQDKCAVTPCFY